MDPLPRQLDVLGTAIDPPWFMTIIGTCSAAAFTPKGSVGVVEEQTMFRSRTTPSRSGK